ncbi:hypothetical protein [Coprobacter sp.]
MNSNLKNISNRIRFRRWSRNRFAAFQSIGKCVSIGYVCKSIVELSLKKQNGILSIMDIIRFLNSVQEDKNDTDKPVDISLQQIETGILLVTPSDNIAQSYLISIIPNGDRELFFTNNSFRSFLFII